MWIGTSQRCKIKSGDAINLERFVISLGGKLTFPFCEHGVMESDDDVLTGRRSVKRGRKVCESIDRCVACAAGEEAVQV